MLVRYSLPNFISGLIPNWLKTIFSSLVRSTVIIFFSFEFDWFRLSLSISFSFLLEEFSLLESLELINSWSISFSCSSVDWEVSVTEYFRLFDWLDLFATFLIFKLEISWFNIFSTCPVPSHVEHFLPNNSYISVSYTHLTLPTIMPV